MMFSAAVLYLLLSGEIVFSDSLNVQEHCSNGGKGRLPLA